MQSREYCETLGAQLVVVDTQPELEMLKELSLEADTIWLGATDEGHEGLWINVDGSDYEEEWLTTDLIKEPDNGAVGNGEQNCMTMINNIMPIGPFGDADATYA